jgi:hypothetical protein
MVKSKKVVTTHNNKSSVTWRDVIKECWWWMMGRLSAARAGSLAFQNVMSNHNGAIGFVVCWTSSLPLPTAVLLYRLYSIRSRGVTMANNGMPSLYEYVCFA